jgi:hippurate hydrolase
MNTPLSSEVIQPLEEELYEKLVAVRRDLHQHPELSWKEERTAQKIAAYLDELGIAYQSEVAGTGIVATLPGRDASRGVITLRADTDALPIHEETGLEFSSRNEGVMHACGHDGHTTILLGAASLLVREAELPVPVKLIFQPAEETGKGALAMIESGALDDTAMIFGGHVDRHYPLGSIIVTDGAVNASSDSFAITISGKGGHGGRPHETVDAVVAGSLLVTALQTIVSREINPAHPSVVSVGTFEAGTASNVIAAHAKLTGTIRAQDPEVRNYLHQSIRRISDAVGQLHGARVTAEISTGTPPVINPVPMADLAREAATIVVGPTSVYPLEIANMGAEDFAYYLEHFAGCYVRFGTVVAEHEAWPAHSSRFDFDEKTIGIAAAYYRELALVAGRHLLNSPPPEVGKKPNKNAAA